MLVFCFTINPESLATKIKTLLHVETYKDADQRKEDSLPFKISQLRDEHVRSLGQCFPNERFI
jgi:hypothetical protein